MFVIGWGGVYDKRFLRPSKQGLRARLNGLEVVVLFWGEGLCFGVVRSRSGFPPPRERRGERVGL